MLDAPLLKLRKATWPYAVTGSLAAARVAPLAPPRLAVMYVPSAETAAAELALRPVERAANVLLVDPFDGVVFERTSSYEGVTYAALSQVAAAYSPARDAARTRGKASCAGWGSTKMPGVDETYIPARRTRSRPCGSIRA